MLNLLQVHYLETNQLEMLLHYKVQGAFLETNLRVNKPNHHKICLETLHLQLLQRTHFLVRSHPEEAKAYLLKSQQLLEQEVSLGSNHRHLQEDYLDNSL